MVCWRLAVENERLTMTEAVEESCELEGRAERAKNIVLSKGGGGARQYIDTMAMASNQLLRRGLVGWIWKCGLGNLGIR